MVDDVEDTGSEKALAVESDDESGEEKEKLGEKDELGLGEFDEPFSVFSLGFVGIGTLSCLPNFTPELLED